VLCIRRESIRPSKSSPVGSGTCAASKSRTLRVESRKIGFVQDIKLCFRLCDRRVLLDGERIRGSIQRRTSLARRKLKQFWRDRRHLSRVATNKLRKDSARNLDRLLGTRYLSPRGRQFRFST